MDFYYIPTPFLYVFLGSYEKIHDYEENTFLAKRKIFEDVVQIDLLSNRKAEL